jgi:dTDP-4-dehydrorhamnose 3,5-epimerase
MATHPGLGSAPFSAQVSRPLRDHGVRAASSREAAPGSARLNAIAGCTAVAVRPNRDERGCLFEIFREEWPGAFKTVQWNACASRSGVMRGVHVHLDYHEFYTLPSGRVFLALRDIRRSSPTFGASVGLEWSAADGFAVPVPAGVAHAVYFLEDSVLAFGLSGYWTAELDVVGCRWDDLDPSLNWPAETAALSRRDAESGSFAEMLEKFETLSAALPQRSAEQRK